MTDSAEEEPAALGLYLYGLARSECQSVVAGLAQEGVVGVEERYPVRTWTAAGVRTGVVAVVGEVFIDDYSERNLQDLAWIASRAARHEAVVVRIMKVSPVLPVKFGTIYRSYDSLEAFLNRHRQDILLALHRLRGKAEWSVKAYLDEECARRVLADQSPDIQSRRAALSSAPGARYLQQKQLDSRIGAALETGVAQLTQDLQQALACQALASTALRLHASAVTGRLERMVFNSSYLLTPELLPVFQSVLSAQQDAFEGIGLTLEIRGPWPPYNFCPSLGEAAA